MTLCDCCCFHLFVVLTYYSNVLVSVYLNILDLFLASHFDTHLKDTATENIRMVWYLYYDYKYNLDLFLWFLFLWFLIISSFYIFVHSSLIFHFSFSYSFFPSSICWGFFQLLYFFLMSSIWFINVLLFLCNLLLLIHIFHASVPLYISNFSCVDTSILCGWVYCCINCVAFHLWCHFPLFCDTWNLFSLGKKELL